VIKVYKSGSFKIFKVSKGLDSFTFIREKENLLEHNILINGKNGSRKITITIRSNKNIFNILKKYSLYLIEELNKGLFTITETRYDIFSLDREISFLKLHFAYSHFSSIVFEVTKTYGTNYKDIIFRVDITCTFGYGIRKRNALKVFKILLKATKEIILSYMKKRYKIYRRKYK